MKLEVGKKYRIEGSDKPWEVVAIDGCGVAWGLVDGLMRYRSLVHIISEWDDKPDPGEGWRLLEVGERLQEGDEFLCPPHGNWHVTGNPAHGTFEQSEDTIYRRRIAPQYVPYTWDDREELRDRWFKQKGDVLYERKVYNIAVERSKLFIDGWEAKEFLQKCEWLDGSPCGKKVV
jgi:hypothetical protein